MAEGRNLDEGLVVRRMISRSGRGRTHLGGSVATVAELAASVGTLVDITSQHDQQSLMDPDSQLAILDAFAGNGELVERGAAACAALSARPGELDRFEADARARAEREDYLRFQLSELEEAQAGARRGRRAQGRARADPRGGEVPAVPSRGARRRCTPATARRPRASPPWPATWSRWPSWTRRWRR